MLAPVRPRRPVVALAALGAGVVLVVSGCSAGQQAQTVEQTSVVDGTAFQAGAVSLRDVGLRAPSGPSYAEGDNAYLEGFILNGAAATDRLVSVSSPIAGQVLLYPDGVSALIGLAPTPTASSTGSATGSATGSPTDTASGTSSSTSSATSTPTDSGTGTASGTPTDSAAATGSATGTASSSSSSSAAALPTPVGDVELPSDQNVQFGYSNGQLSIVFVGLTKALFPSEPFQVTFTFATAGSVTATVAVKLPTDRTLDAPTLDTEPSEGGGEG